MFEPFSWLVGLPKRVKLVSLYMKAQELSGLRRPNEAMDVLKIFYSVSGEPMPSANVMVELNMLAMIIFAELKQYESSISCARLSIKQLKSGSGRYDRNDRIYMTYFCRGGMEYSLRESGEEPLKEGLEVGVSYKEIAFKKVRSDLRRKFIVTAPLPSENAE